MSKDIKTTKIYRDNDPTNPSTVTEDDLGGGNKFTTYDYDDDDSDPATESKGDTDTTSSSGGRTATDGSSDETGTYVPGDDGQEALDDNS